MAASLLRLPWTVFNKNQLQCKQVLIFSFTNHFPQFKFFSTNHQNRPTSNKTVKRVLTYAAFFSGLSYIWYKWKNDFIPTIHARTNNVDHNRDKYNFIADVVEISAPSVVYIEIKDSKKKNPFTGKPLNLSDGTGFIVQSDGLILTNAHVINKPNAIVKVHLYDGKSYTGIVEDIDLQSDLATVRINKTNLPEMKLGNSSNLRPGEFVVAIGSPFSLSNTITSGIISSVNRASEELGLSDKIMSYIQTDAAITFGNSGGPLVNLDGEAIGVNAMRITAGISFAIPIDYVKDFLRKAEIRRKKRGTQNIADSSQKRYLGITMLTLTPNILIVLQNMDQGISDVIKHGVLIWKVSAGSPAHIGGLQASDVITHVNDEIVASAQDMYKAIETSNVLKLTIIRNMEVLHLNVETKDM